MQISKLDKTLLLPFLLRFPENEHDVWLDEAIRLGNIVIRYQALKQKWRLNKLLGKYNFTKEVYDLCKEAACENLIIIAREPSRARPPSPYTG
jgi:hypothetical protein